MKAQAGDDRLLVLYDSDCGICTRSARVLRRLDRSSRLHLVPLQDAPDLAGSPSLDMLLEAIHVRDERGRWKVAGAAWIRIADEIAVLRPLAHLGRLPTIRRFVEWIYVLVAGNRHLLGRLLGDDVCETESRRHDQLVRPAR